MENEYFLVPVTDEKVKVAGTSLNKRFKIVTKDFYDEKKLPKNIVVVKQGDVTYELVTKKDVEADPKYLKQFSISGDAIVDIYCEDPYFSNHVENLLGRVKTDVYSEEQELSSSYVNGLGDARNKAHKTKVYKK